MPRLCRECATADEVRRGRAWGGATAPPGKPLHLGSRGSCLLRQGDAVDPAALLFGRGKTEPELFLQSSREDAANGMTLPAGHARHLVDRGTLGLTQHRDHYVL